MKSLKWSLLLLATLLLGVCIGIVGSGLIIRYRFDSVAREGPDVIPGILTAQLTRRLNLTASQQKTLESQIRKAQHEFKAVRRQYEPQLQSIVTNTIAEIQTILTDEQRARLDAVLDFQRSRWLATPKVEPATAPE